MSKYKLPQIQGADLDGRAFPDFVWNADLIYFDGPFLSLFRQENGGDAFFIWLDSDSRKHRWAVVNVDRRQLGGYLNGELPLYKIIKESVDILIFDTTPKGRRTNIKKIASSKLPPNYWPEADSYLNSHIATEAALQLRAESAKRFELKLSGDDIYVEDLAAIPKLYEQLYSFIYGLEHLHRPAVRERITSAVKSWTGGFASVNLFSGLKAVIPSVHRARVSDMHYASPGQIGMELLPDMASKIAESIDKIGRNFLATERIYKDCYSYFRQEKLSGFEDMAERRGENLSSAQTLKIQGYVMRFLDDFSLEAFAASFVALEIDALGQLRILLAYYRRLRRLRSYVDRGILNIPKRASAKPT